MSDEKPPGNLLLNFPADGHRIGARWNYLSQIEGPDDVGTTFGLISLKENWIAVDGERARHILSKLLHRNMAYGDERMDSSLASEVAKTFLDTFPDDASFFTNGTWDEEPQTTGATTFGPQWSPATSATFDGGIIVCSKTKIGIFWIEDED